MINIKGEIHCYRKYYDAVICHFIDINLKSIQKK